MPNGKNDRIKKVQARFNLRSKNDIKRKFGKFFVEPRQKKFLTSKCLCINLIPPTVLGVAVIVYMPLSPLYIASMVYSGASAVIMVKNKKKIEAWARLPAA